MTFFLHLDELNSGINAAANALGTADESSAEQRRLELVATLNSMREFATNNLNSMLKAMGYNSIEELNNALQNYNHLNISLQQLLPAFSEPQISEVLVKAGIDKVNTSADYGLITSAVEDGLMRLFPELVTNGHIDTDFEQIILKKLQEPSVRDALITHVAGQLFGGIDISDNIVLDLMNGEISFGQAIPKIVSAINKNAHANQFTGINMKTLAPFRDFLQDYLKQTTQIFINEENYDSIIKLLEQSAKATQLNSEIIKKRIGRGGITISSKVKVKTDITDTGIQADLYLENIKANIDPSVFNLNSRRKDESIEAYVNRICQENPGIYEQLKQNIKDYYWRLIQQYLPIGFDSPISQNDFDEIIEKMTLLQGNNRGNIGWFFSQGGTKALGAGMFGEIAGMIYMKVLCPNLKSDLNWAGGVTDGAKPPADIILEHEGKKYGIQIKNYTSGSTLSADYGLLIKNIVDSAANNEKNRRDLMTTQAVHELGITEYEIEAIQNIIIAKTFNVPYEKIGDSFEQVPNVPVFMGAYNKIQETYLQATRYLAIISLIMHRVQYYETINRQVGASKFEDQVQNTLWLINGSMFVSSVQIFNELIEYIDTVANNFFSINASVHMNSDDVKKFGLDSGRITIVEYLNLNRKNLGTSALSALSAKITTNYKMSAFNP